MHTLITAKLHEGFNLNEFDSELRETTIFEREKWGIDDTEILEVSSNNIATIKITYIGKAFPHANLVNTLIEKTSYDRLTVLEVEDRH